jgi:hypothetical protein
LRKQLLDIKVERQDDEAIFSCNAERPILTTNVSYYTAVQQFCLTPET